MTHTVPCGLMNFAKTLCDWSYSVTHSSLCLDAPMTHTVPCGLMNFTRTLCDWSYSVTHSSFCLDAPMTHTVPCGQMNFTKTLCDWSYSVTHSSLCLDAPMTHTVPCGQMNFTKSLCDWSYSATHSSLCLDAPMTDTVPCGQMNFTKTLCDWSYSATHSSLCLDAPMTDTVPCGQMNFTKTLCDWSYSATHSSLCLDAPMRDTVPCGQMNFTKTLCDWLYSSFGLDAPMTDTVPCGNLIWLVILTHHLVLMHQWETLFHVDWWVLLLSDLSSHSWYSVWPVLSPEYIGHNHLSYPPSLYKERFELHHEETCKWGFRPGPTQARMYNHSKWLDAWNFGLARSGIALRSEKQRRWSAAWSLHRSWSASLFPHMQNSRFFHDTTHLTVMILKFFSDSFEQKVQTQISLNMSFLKKYW